MFVSKLLFFMSHLIILTNSLCFLSKTVFQVFKIILFGGLHGLIGIFLPHPFSNNIAACLSVAQTFTTVNRPYMMVAQSSKICSFQLSEQVLKFPACNVGENRRAKYDNIFKLFIFYFLFLKDFSNFNRI